jgi:ABC-type sugar transport system substrate-binding protein
MRLPRMLVLLVALAALTLTACTNEVSDGGGEGATGGTSAPQAEGVTGRPVKVGFSAPGADHGWLKAITDNARKAADDLGVDLILSEGTNDAHQPEAGCTGHPPARRRRAHPDRAEGHAGRHPGGQRRP